MNKLEMVAEIAKRTDNTQKDVEEVMNCFYGLVGECLAEGEKVQIMGFGTYKTSYTEGREGVNPRNQEETITIPGGFRIYFSAGKNLKDTVNAKTKKKVSKKAAPKSKAVANKSSKKVAKKKK